MQPGRRSFLFGRARAGTDAWGRFCQRMRTVCRGAFEDDGQAPGHGQARLSPARMADVAHARALCAEYGVRLALAGVAGAHESPAHPTLWVEPGASLAGLEPLPGRPGFWRAEAGCTLGALRAAGCAQFEALPAAQTVAAWLSGPDTRQSCRPGRALDSGVAAVDVMLADGTRATLGPFGERDAQPLRTAVLQRLVPELFQLAMGEDAELCRRQHAWPACARLDALRPEPPAGVNLAHLLLGQAGAFAWVEAVLLVALESPPAAARLPSLPTPVDAASQHLDASARAAASRIDARCKTLFDPQGVFPPLPGLSS